MTTISNSRGYKSGISLVELSIVLVIIGLLVSGIIYGVNMVQRAKMLKVGKEFEKYTIMINQFYDIYKAYPGLLEDAFDKWGTDCAPTAEECNCMGCPRWGAYYGYSLPAKIQDTVRAWRHLWLAGFLEKETTLVTGYVVTPGENVPASVFHRNSGFVPDAGFRRRISDGPVFPGLGNILILGHKSATHFTFDPLFTGTEAMYLTRKIDDGNAVTGRMRASSGFVGGLTAATDPCNTPTGEFKTEAEQIKRCILHYDTGGHGGLYN